MLRKSGILILRKLGIEQGEGLVFAWGAAALFLIGWADVSVKNVSETYFLKRVGVDLLPYFFLLSALLLVGTTLLVGRIASRSNRLRLLPRTLFALAVALIPLWFLVLQNVTSGFGVLLIASKQMQSIALLVFFIAMADLLHARQAKRLIPPLMAGFTLGNMLGSFASEPISRLIGIHGLLPLSSGALLLGALMTLPLQNLRTARLDRITKDSIRGRPGGSGSETLDASESNFRTLWRDSRLFRLLFICAACSGLVGPMLYFQFSYVADLATQGVGGEAKLMAFYSQFRGWINFGVLITQLGLAAHLYRRLGVPLATAISPLVYLAGFAGLSFRLSLPVGIAAMAGTKLQDDAVHDPAVRVLYSLFPEAIRSKAMALLEEPVKRAGGAVGNVMTIGANFVGSAAWVGYAALPITVVWLAAVLMLRRAYPSLLLRASARPAHFGDGFDISGMLDADTLRGLSRHLRHPDPARCRVAADLVSEAEPGQAARILAEAAVAAPDATRGILISALDRLVEGSVESVAASAATASHLEALLEEANRLGDRDRADVIQTYGRVTLDSDVEGATDVLARFLNDPSPAVRLTAAVALSQRGFPPQANFEIDSVLEAASEDADSVVRRAAREEYRALLLRGEPDAQWKVRVAKLAELLTSESDRAETARALADIAKRHGSAAAGAADPMLVWRDDKDAEVRAAVLRFIGYAGLENQSGWLVSHAGLAGDESAESVGSAAREGLRALGLLATEALLVELCFGKRSSREAILPLVRDLHVGAETLRGLYERELDAYRHRLIALHAAIGAGASAILVQRLGERLDEGLQTVLHLLAAVHDDDRIVSLSGPLRRERGGRQHAIILEALEALLGAAEQAQLMPLLEDQTVAERSRAAALALGISVPSPTETIRGLLSDQDELTGTLARATLPVSVLEGLATGTKVQDDGEMLSPVERALLLRGIPLFEGLTTRQLMNLAELVNEEEYPPGSSICQAGEPSDCMYIIVEGEVAITTSADTELAQLGPKDFFGEIGVFEGATRSANAVTRDSSVSLLTIDRGDLLNLMEELPGIAIYICQRLSGLVRNLTSRVTV